SQESGGGMHTSACRGGPCARPRRKAAAAPTEAPPPVGAGLVPARAGKPRRKPAEVHVVPPPARHRPPSPTRPSAHDLQLPAEPPPALAPRRSSDPGGGT